MKLLWFLLSAAVMVQAWPLGIVNIVEKPKSKVTKEATKLLSEFFMREDGIQAYRLIRIGNRVKDGASAIASSVWQKDATKTTYSEDRVKRSTSTMVPNVCQEDAMKTTDSEVRANGSASTIAPSVSQEAGIKHADSGDRVEAGTELASRPERKTEMNSIDSQEEEEEIKHADSGHREEVTTEFASKPKQEATSNVIDIDVTKPLACELSINYYEVCDPETQSEPTCIDNWEYCRSSNKPCCGQNKLEDGTVRPKYWTCFEFGEGVCTPLHEIHNLDFYAKLINKLDSTNFKELQDKYWQSVHLV